jgi:hypothetical protein
MGAFSEVQMEISKGPGRSCGLLVSLVLIVGTGTALAKEDPILIGLDTNPPPTEGYSPETVRKWLQIGVDAGVTQMSMSPKWNEIEKSPGHYNFSELESHAQLAAEFKLPVYLNIRIVDTNNRAVPEPYREWSFDDPRMIQALHDLILALGPKLRCDVRWVAIGNEVDSYFKAHRKEIPPYRKLLDNVLGSVRQAFPGALFTVNFTCDALDDLYDNYKPLTDIVEFISLTYYPLRWNFTFRDPSVAHDDIRKIMEAAGSRQVFFQEVGYASGELVDSSQIKQAQFMAGVFLALREFRSRVIAAHFVWMSDIPQSLVDQFGEYYKLPGSDRFKAFLGTLGYFDREGKPKMAWKVFEREARRMAQP